MSTFFRYSFIALAFVAGVSSASAQSSYTVGTEQSHQTTSVQVQNQRGSQPTGSVKQRKPERSVNRSSNVQQNDAKTFGPEFFDELQRNAP